MTDQEATLLVADIGATKTDIALFMGESEWRTPLELETFRNKDYSCAEDVFDRFLKQRALRGASCCIAAAGPVASETAHLANLAWTIRSTEFVRRYGFRRCVLVNDVYALGALVPRLCNTDVSILKEGAPAMHGTKAVIAPGTGLGHSFLTWDGAGYGVHPSEGGHIGFAPANALETELLVSLRHELGLVTVEDVCSGTGLPRIHGFLSRSVAWKGRAGGEVCASPTTESIVARSREVAGCPVCRESVRLFCSILVTEARNTALKLLASGGVYIAGSFSLRLTGRVRDAFGSGAFAAHDQTGLLDAIPVYLILDSHPVILGAYWVARGEDASKTA